MNKGADKFFLWFSWIAGLGVLLVVLLLVGFLAQRGIGTLGSELLFGDASWWAALTGREPVFGGLWPAVVGTLVLVLGASILAIPLGVATGIYLAEFASGWRRALLGLCVDLLSGIPSIVMGLFGFGLILFLRATILPSANVCLLLSMICLCLLVLPYLIRTTETALQGLPEHIRLIGPSLGLSHWQSIRHIYLPAASRGILSGAILAVGRVAEDTAVILLTGVVANAGMPGGLTDKFEALPFAIFYLAAEHRTVAELNRAFGAALILLCLTGVLFGLAYWLHYSLERRWKTRA